MSAKTTEHPKIADRLDRSGKNAPIDSPDPEGIDRMPTKALADRQVDATPVTEREAQPVVAHQDRRHK